nr:hypothetical protein [Tanacetum cinerariifolium]
MTNAEIKGFDKGDEEVTDAAKADAKKTLEVKDDLRVTKLEKDVSELKKIDLSVEAIAALKTQVPTIVDDYLGSKVRDTPTINLEQESMRSPSDILKIKREQAEKQKMPHFTVKTTDKVALKEYDLKTLIEDENAMNNGVVDALQDYKRKHDQDDDDDDEDPLAGPNQIKTTKRRITKESMFLKKL